VEIIVGPSAERDEPAPWPLVAISAGEVYGVSRGGKAPLVLGVGRLFDFLDKKSLQPDRESGAHNIGRDAISMAPVGL
jgi:hypothetical protein